MTRLDLSSYQNDLTTQQDVFFSPLINLKELNLMSCGLNVLKTACFTCLCNLESLNLGDNKIEELQKEVFKGLSNLKELRLNKNTIKKVHDLSFRGLKRLEFLDLNKCMIELIEENSFEAICKSIIYLSLESNLIQKFAAYTFKHMYILKYLNISNKSLESIDSALFEDLISLTHLYIKRCSISSIESFTFKNVFNLKLLKLDAKNIGEFLDSNMFKGLENLESFEIKFSKKDKIDLDKSILVLKSLKNLGVDHVTFKKYFKNNSCNFKELFTNIKPYKTNFGN